MDCEPRGIAVAHRYPQAYPLFLWITPAAAGVCANVLGLDPRQASSRKKASAASVAQPAMQQDHGRAGAEGGIPDASAVTLDMALLICGRQRFRAMCGKPCQVVIEGVHAVLRVSVLLRSHTQFVGVRRHASERKKAMKRDGAP